MSTATAPVTGQTGNANADQAQRDRQSRELYGKAGKPIPATKAYRRAISDFPDANTTAESWMLENEKTGTVVFVNLYNGKAGKKFDLAAATHPMGQLNEKEQRRRQKSYTEVPVKNCPVATVA